MNNLIHQLLENKILVLDGAMGTMIQSFNLTEMDFRGEDFVNHTLDLKGCNDLLSVTHPQIIEEIHDQYLNAGADIIETNTFNSNFPGLLDYGLEDFVYKINFEIVYISVPEDDIILSYMRLFLIFYMYSLILS